MDTKPCTTCGTTTGENCEWHYRRIRSREDAFAAGRAHAKARGDKLTPTQIVRLAALIRPHLDGAREPKSA